MTKKHNLQKRPRQNIPEITLQPKQMEFANAKQSIVFFGGGAGGKVITAAFKLP
jgi:hypothetical protein